MSDPISYRDTQRELLTPCKNHDALHKWIDTFTGLKIPRRAVCPHHTAPFDYLVKSYFEPANDIVVWAPRGGGKTRLAAVATMLDLLHKPGIAVTILGGSLAQSLRMWEHLLPDLERSAGDHLVGRSRSRSVRLLNASHANIVAQSEHAVRGLRIQKLRCDELELFNEGVLEAAKLTTRSLRLADGSEVAGTMEALSTMHAPWGLMHTLIEQATATNRPVVKWCVLDVLERCPAERECASCPLWEDCRGLAKNAEGFLSIEDAIRLKQRASTESWEAEMLCKRPSVKGSVFPTFDAGVHVREDGGPLALVPAAKAVVFGIDALHASNGMGETPTVSLAIDFGFANPFACLWVRDDGKTVHVFDEYVQSGRTMEEHLSVIESRPWGRVKHIACDPAGNARNDQTAESNVHLLRRRQYVVKTRRSLIIDGLELIRRGLKTAVGDVSLYVHPRCVNLIRALRSYHYPTGFNSELPFKDGENDHLIDALRYFYVNRSNKEGRAAMAWRRY